MYLLISAFMSKMSIDSDSLSRISSKIHLNSSVKQSTILFVTLAVNNKNILIFLIEFQDLKHIYIYTFHCFMLIIKVYYLLSP